MKLYQTNDRPFLVLTLAMVSKVTPHCVNEAYTHTHTRLYTLSTTKCQLNRYLAERVIVELTGCDRTHPSITLCYSMCLRVKGCQFVKMYVSDMCEGLLMFKHCVMHEHLHTSPRSCLCLRVCVRVCMIGWVQRVPF